MRFSHSFIACRYREVVTRLSSDIGGDPSEAQAIIIKRAADYRALVRGGRGRDGPWRGFYIAAFTTATNALRPLMADLGLERKTKDITDLRAHLAQARDDA